MSVLDWLTGGHGGPPLRFGLPGGSRDSAEQHSAKNDERVEARTGQEAGSGPVAEGASREATTATGDDDTGWRGMISGGFRELSWAQIVENLTNATEAYRTNPLAFRLIQLQVDHVLGEGMLLQAEDAAVQRELDLFWHHELNNLAVAQFDFLTALALDGEIFVTLHTNPFDRTTYLRLVPASLIDEIETNPDDLQDELRYHQQADMLVSDGLVAAPSQARAQGRWWAKGDMWHFAINRPAGVVRGQSDLAPLLPWLRRYRDWLTDRVRLNKYRTAYVWHLTLRGAGRAEILKRQADLAVPPSPGSVIVSNENETWEAVQPKIDAGDVFEDGRALRLMIAGGAGVPLFWLSEADRTARGTATEQAGPTFRHYRQRQLVFGWAMRVLAVEALHRRGFSAVTVADVRAEFPELDIDAALVSAQAVGALADSLGGAVDRGWLSDADAAAIYQHYAGEGVDLPRGGRRTGERSPQRH